MKEYMIKDNIGEHKVKEYKNGVKVKILKTSSLKYTKDKLKRIEKAQIRENEIKMELEKEILIKQKMRELAIAELEKEGKI
jgi:hypothetical protein